MFESKSGGSFYLNSNGNSLLRRILAIYGCGSEHQIGNLIPMYPSYPDPTPLPGNAGNLLKLRYKERQDSITFQNW
jgi:hypothetical protein